MSIYSPQTAERGEPEGVFSSYIGAIRAHPRIVAAIAAFALLVSIAFVLLRAPTYEATADLLVSPVAQEDPTLTGLPVLRDSGDPVRTVQTAATLVESRTAADRAAQELDNGLDGEELLDAITVEARGESNVLAVTASSGSADEAAAIANTFAQSVLRTRAEALGNAVSAEIDQLEAQLKATPAADPVAQAELTSRLQQLRSIEESGDPTLSLSQEALSPDSPVGTPAYLTVLLGLIAGLILGTGTALLVDLTAKRVRDEDDARQLYDLPVLVRVPELSRRKLRGSEPSSWYVAPEIREPFRTLAVQLFQRIGPAGAVMVTSPSAGDGKTTSAINLAYAFAAGGRSVILLDFDLRKPQVGSALGIRDGVTLLDLLSADTKLESLLYSSPQHLDLRVLPLLAREGGVLVEPVARELPRLIREARAMADYVIVDTAPLGEVGDALPLASEVEDIVLVVRPGSTRRAQVEATRELLERASVTPAGIAVLASEPGAARGYYGSGTQSVASALVVRGEFKRAPGASRGAMDEPRI